MRPNPYLINEIRSVLRSEIHLHCAVSHGSGRQKGSPHLRIDVWIIAGYLDQLFIGPTCFQNRTSGLTS